MNESILSLQPYSPLRAARKAAPCRKVTFTDSLGVIHSRGCGRRTCPRCQSSYATRLGTALKELHGTKATHILLTVAEENIGDYPTELDYITSKNHEREVIRCLNHGITPTYHNPLLPEIREKIKKSSKRANQALRKFLDDIEASTGHRPGYCRAIEYGEHHTHRWHCHIIIMLDSQIVLSQFPDAQWDNRRKVHISHPTRYWTDGMVRIKTVDSAKGAIAYVASYESKSSPGRVTCDRKTSALLAAVRRFNSSFSLSKPLEYVPIGHTAREIETQIDLAYDRLNKQLKEDNELESTNNQHSRKRTPRNTPQLPRRIIRLAERRPTASTRSTR